MKRKTMRFALVPAAALTVTLGVMTLNRTASAQQTQAPTLGQQPQGSAQGQQGQPNQPAKPGQSAPPGQSAQPGQAGQPGQPPAHQVTKQESDDFNAIRQEASTGLDPDHVIQLATDFEKKYPDSPMLSYSDMFAAGAYQQKNNIDKSIEFGEKSLKLRPDNLMSLIMMADLLPTPQATRGDAATKDKRLSEAEDYANAALKLIPALPKQAAETDDQAKKRKDALNADLHSALGMVHLQRSAEGLTGPDKDELAKAEQEYKLATTATDKPSPQDFFRLGEAYTNDGKVDDAIDSFSKAAQIGAGGPIQPYAEQRIEELKKRKAGAAPASAPAKQ